MPFEGRSLVRITVNEVNNNNLNKMTKRSLQIDVLGEAEATPGMMECNIYIDGRCCTFWTTKANYEALLYDKVFIRDGERKDSAKVLNTTNVYYEEKK